MAWRLRLVPEKTDYDFFRLAPITFGASLVATALSILLVIVMGLNYGIDFRGGTTIRTESTTPVDNSYFHDRSPWIASSEVAYRMVAENVDTTRTTY